MLYYNLYAILLSFQKRATKFVPDLRSAKYRVRLEAIGIPSLAHRRRRGDLIQYFKIIKGYNKVTWIKEPSLAASLSTQGPARNIRGHANRIRREELTSFTPREDFLSNRVVADWNALPVAVIEAKSINSLKTNSINILKNLNSYFLFNFSFSRL